MSQLNNPQWELLRESWISRGLLAALQGDPGNEDAPWRALRACILADLGDYDAAGVQAGAVIEDDAQPPEVLALASAALGLIAVARSEIETALLRYDDAVARGRAAHDGWVQAFGMLASADALLDRDGPADGSAAVGRLAGARELIERDALDSLRPRLELALARARASAGDLEGAVEAATAVRDAADDGKQPEMGWKACAALAAMNSTRGAEFVARRHELAAMERLESLVVSLPRASRDAFWRHPDRRAIRLRASATTQHRVPEPEPQNDARAMRLLDITKRLASERDLDRLLERITDAAVDLSGAERGFVLLPDAAGQLEPKLVRGAAADDPSVAFSRSIAEAVLIDGEPILTVDAGDDHRLSEYLSVHKLMLKSVACLPIRASDGVLGVLYLEHRVRRGRFHDQDVDLLLAFADQAAIALSNARLLAELEARSQSLEEANRKLGEANAQIERVLVARTDELAETRAELDRTRIELRGRYDQEGIIGRSQPMRRVFAVIDRVKESSVPVVIHGESGTGKELVARAIHYSGSRAKAPFVAVNCAAIPDALLESELFGHVRGAFTGADRDRQGVLAQASGGTLFLDEIGDMPPKMQVDLLRVLQDGRVRPIGAEESIEVDVRVVSASNKLLSHQVESGAFREDLYYRLNVVEIRLPPLRERREDLPLLSDHLLAGIAKREGGSRKRISREALERLAAHPLPGNVRQLEHVLLNACVMVDGEIIEPDDLALGDEVAANERVSLPSMPAAMASEPPPQNFGDFKDTEKQRILTALESNGWNRAKAARAMGIPRRTFYRRLKEYEIL